MAKDFGAHIAGALEASLRQSRTAGQLREARGELSALREEMEALKGVYSSARATTSKQARTVVSKSSKSSLLPNAEPPDLQRRRKRCVLCCTATCTRPEF